MWMVAAFTALFGATTAQHYEHLSLQSGLQNVAVKPWPALRFHISVKHSSLMVHGQSKFTIFANPVVFNNGTTSVLYDTIATFTENSTVYQYTQVNGISYVLKSHVEGSRASHSVKCLESDNLPSVNSFVAGLQEVFPLSEVSSGSNHVFECSSKNKFKVYISGVTFGLCDLSSTGFFIAGSEINIKVEYSKDRKDIHVPTQRATLAANCTVVASPSLVTSTGKLILTGQPIARESTRILKADMDVRNHERNSSCSCKSTPRPCIFIHGQGIKIEMAENQDTFPTIYWGNMTNHAPCCTSIKYAVLNTVNYSWTDDSQQQKVCDRALAVSETSTKSKISDTIIITHSMGALMLSGAIAKGKCSIAASSTWISTGAPMRGNVGSKYLLDSCDGKTNLIMEMIAKKTGKCPVSASIRSLVYEGSDYASAELNQAYKAAQEVYRTYVYAAMCSYKHSGLISRYQWQFWVLGSIFPHLSSQNDGLVDFHSCAGGIPESKFGKNYRDQFYLTKLNHIDLAFLSGDALFDEAKMPVKWFECLL
ncbi:RxLR-like protein [Plasmopara halstedii]|uniref:RxLR-like protein n=1 Tax=Plasmopara halstedii TaxID=4781 RepID=A0A0P1AYD8_PLAHL|nr:RxLR-like protein [Plasmopara halstedii]CEG46848.1 RxLR-like protein [Plasmopara halstedii]|eukprot:XP_024583217.1 RxLR-like protein [Plasmopara halstedii]